MMFILGAKGREWAWKNKKWESLEHFNRVQRAWSRIWLILLAVAVLGIITSVVLAAMNAR
jgi:hypothetical protein